jgi:hypothetical protein
MRYLVALILIATTPFGSLGENPASSLLSGAVVEHDVNCTCSSSASVEPPLLPRTCHHDVQSDDDGEVIHEEHDLLHSSAEEIKAQIRRETAANQAAVASLAEQAEEEQGGVLWPHLLLSAEDVKAQIRREARLQTARGHGGAIDDNLLATSVSTAAFSATTTTTTRTSSTDCSVVVVENDDDQPAVVPAAGGDTAYSTSFSSSRTRTTSVPARPAEPVVGDTRSPRGTGEEPSTATQQDIAFSARPSVIQEDLQNDKVLLPVELEDKNYARDRGTVPVPNQKASEENGPSPPTLPTDGSAEPMLSSSSSSSSSFSTSATNTLNEEQYNNSTNTERDDRTMLDVFGERAKEFLTRRVVRFDETHVVVTTWATKSTFSLSLAHTHTHTHTPPPLLH